MTPEEAAGFHEDDEDPREVIARFDAGPHVVTARPYDAGGHLAPGWARARNGTSVAEQIRRGFDYIRSAYGTGGPSQ